MPLLIRLPTSAGDQEEMAMIELQGDLECRTDSPLNSQFIGDLYYKKQMDGTTLPILVIGHHLLSGKMQILEKPLALMKREENNSVKSEFILKAIVTKKICFKTRPKPIISSY